MPSTRWYQRTAQYEGIADEPSGAERERVTGAYYAAFADGRARLAWTGLIYIRVQPLWIRYSDYNQSPPEIEEFDRLALGLS